MAQHETQHEPKDSVEGTAFRPSLSDLEESPLAGADTRSTFRRRRWHFSWPSNESLFWKYWALAATVCSLLFLTNLVYVQRARSCATDREASTEMLRGYPDPVDTWKDKNLIETKYFRDIRYMTLDHNADYLWKEHTLMSTGNVQLPDGNGSTSLKSISMFHQMHCLAKLRLTLQQAHEGQQIGTDWKDDAHWPHCMDYLRSSILCFADGTLESVTKQPGPDPGTWVRVIDGGVETRYCRDTRPLYDLERQYGPNSQYVGDAEPADFEVAPGR